MKRYFLGIDQGTTGSTALLIDEKWNVVATRNVEHTQIFPKPGWVEHDADEIFSTQLEVAKQALANVGATAANIAAIGITNQRETTVCWNKHTGKPIHNAIVWQCRRTAGYCDHLRDIGLVPTIREKTGACRPGGSAAAENYREGSSLAG